MLSRLSRAKIPAISLECAGRVHKMNNWSRKYTKTSKFYAYTQMALHCYSTINLFCSTLRGRIKGAARSIFSIM